MAFAVIPVTALKHRARGSPLPLNHSSEIINGKLQITLWRFWKYHPTKPVFPLKNKSCDVLVSVSLSQLRLFQEPLYYIALNQATTWYVTPNVQTLTFCVCAFRRGWFNTNMTLFSFQKNWFQSLIYWLSFFYGVLGIFSRFITWL